MRVVSTVKSTVLVTTSALVMLCGFVSQVAVAQMTPPPRHDSKSATGVSYRGGGFSFEEQDLAIGDSDTGLSLIRSYNSSTDSTSDPYLAAVGWTHSMNIYVASQVLPDWPEETEEAPNRRDKCVYNVVGGGASVGFVLNAPFKPGQTGCGGLQVGTYVPITASGATLEYISATLPYFQYVGEDGSIINFAPGSGRALNWTKPDGTRLEFTYSGGKLKSVFSNRGWALLFESQYKICAVNLAQTFVNSTSNCPAGTQQVTYTYSPGNYIPSWNLMTSVTRGGRTRRYEYATNDHVNCIKDTGQNSCRIKNTYFSCPEDPRNQYKQYRVHLSDPVTTQVDAAGRVYTYKYDINDVPNEHNLCPRAPWDTQSIDYRPFSLVRTTLTETGVSEPSVATTDTASQLIGLSDPLKRKSSFGYAGSAYYAYETGPFRGATYPEGNSYLLTGGPRGNVLAERMIPKPDSGLAEQVTSYTFPATCDNRKTCNKPTSMTNPSGGVTEYAYDPTHGGVTRETGPADVNGVRAVKRYAYIQRASNLKVSGSGYAPSPYPVWLLSEIRTCKTSATVNDSCQAGSGDEIITTFDYGAAGAGPSNLQPIGMVVTADGQALRTCYRYDDNGRKIAETSPNANLSSCAL